MRKFCVLLLVVFAVLAAACSSSDTSEQIEGVWKDTTNIVYVEFDEDGQYQVAATAEFEGPFEWGDYTFDGETLTMNAAPDAYNCADMSIAWTVAFSDDGEEASMTFVEDSCEDPGRSQDLIFRRQQP
jgi:hypothetical protein